jgi:hypothetical protein
MIIDKVVLYSNNLGVEEIVAGLNMLEKMGFISVKKVEFKRLKKKGQFYGDALVFLQIGDYGVLIDNEDSFDIIKDNDLLNNITHYFKRSFRLCGYSLANIQFFPLGVKFKVFNDNFSHYYYPQLLASFYQQNTFYYIITRSSVLSKIFNVNGGLNNLQYNKLINFDIGSKEDLIFYNTRLWNPDTARTNEEKDRRFILNEQRIKYVTQFKKTFGYRYIGGIFDDELSRKLVAKDLIIKGNNTYKKRNYIDLLRKSKIGISINGNHPLGCVISEYAAFGLAVICDPISVLLPSSPGSASSFYQATTLDLAIDECEKILSSEDYYKEIIRLNYDYFLKNIHPIGKMFNVFNSLL